MENSCSSSSHLPDDIIIEILRKLPVKNLVRFCCVCKYWLELMTKDHVFIRSQLKNSINNSFFKNALVSSDERSERCTCHKVSDLQPQKLTEKFAHASLNSAACRIIFRDGKFEMSGCCDGIICFVHRNCPRSASNLMVYLCNPALRQCRALPPSNYQKPRYSEVTVCFFFDPVSDDYKVVKIILTRLGFIAEMYSLRSNSWKPFSLKKNIAPSVHKIFGPFRPLVHNGFPYWLTWRDDDSIGPCWRTVLNVLDMVQENVLEIPVPTDITCAYLELFQGSLSIFGRVSTGDFGIWVMKEDRTGTTWIKQRVIFNTTFSRPVFIPLTCRTTGVTASWKHLIFTTAGRGNAVLYDPKEQKVVDDVNGVSLEGNFSVVEHVVVDLVASLVSVIPPADEITLRKVILKVIFNIFNGGKVKHNNKPERSYFPPFSFLSRMFACFLGKR